MPQRMHVNFLYNMEYQKQMSRVPLFFKSGKTPFLMIPTPRAISSVGLFTSFTFRGLYKVALKQQLILLLSFLHFYSQIF